MSLFIPFTTVETTMTPTEKINRDMLRNIAAAFTELANDEDAHEWFIADLMHALTEVPRTGMREDALRSMSAVSYLNGITETYERCFNCYGDGDTCDCEIAE
jgi:hypothetical protein